MANETRKLATNPHEQHWFKGFIETFLYKRYSQQIADYLETVAIRRRPVKKQGKENCATRSARELLRDSLPEDVFSSIYHFINDEFNSIEVMIEKLNAVLVGNKLIQQMINIKLQENSGQNALHQPAVQDFLKFWVVNHNRIDEGSLLRQVVDDREEHNPSAQLDKHANLQRAAKK